MTSVILTTINIVTLMNSIRKERRKDSTFKILLINKDATSLMMTIMITMDMTIMIT